MVRDNGSRTTGFEEGHVEEISSTRLTLDRSAVRSVSADDIDISKSAVGVARFQNGTIRLGTAGVVVGRSVAMDEVRTGVLISPVVRGDVHTFIDMRSAVAIGFGMVLGKAMLAGARALVRRVTG